MEPKIVYLMHVQLISYFQLDVILRNIKTMYLRIPQYLLHFYWRKHPFSRAIPLFILY